MIAEVWVWLSREREGEIAPCTFEALYEAHGLARRLGLPLVAYSDGDVERALLSALAPWGVSEIRTVGGDRAPHPLVAPGAPPLQELVAGGPPRVFLFCADAFGKVAAPLWAAQVGGNLVTGATSVTADSDRFAIQRPTLGDRFEALVTAPLKQPLTVTLIPGAVGEVTPPAMELGAPPVAASGRSGGEPESAANFSLRPPDPATLNIADAERIVAFGRGAFSREAITLVERLAERLGAAVAGTRPAADEGWLPFERQVGLTGAIVRPKLYVAVGISGAPYHMVGVKDPETLVAINSDPEAPILGIADLGIVGDLFQVVPRLISQLDEGVPLPGGGRIVEKKR